MCLSHRYRPKAKTSTQAFEHSPPIQTCKAYMKTPSVSRPQFNLKKISSTRPKLSAREKQQQQTVSAGLAICLLGNYKTGKMFDSEYEEEVRKQAVMQVSLFPCRFLSPSSHVLLPSFSFPRRLSHVSLPLLVVPHPPWCSMLTNRKSSRTQSCGRNGKLPKPH